MTLQEIKNLIISRSKELEVCDTLHDVQVAETKEEVIESGLSLLMYSYPNDIVDDDLLAEFDETLLNSYGIYTISNPAITNPSGDIFLLKTVQATITLDNENKCKIYISGNAEAMVNLSGSAYCRIDASLNAKPTLNISSQAMAFVDLKDESEVMAITNDGGVIHVSQKGETKSTLTANDESYGRFRLSENATLNYTATGAAQVIFDAWDNATVN